MAEINKTNIKEAFPNISDDALLNRILEYMDAIVNTRADILKIFKPEDAMKILGDISSYADNWRKYANRLLTTYYMIALYEQLMIQYMTNHQREKKQLPYEEAMKIESPIPILDAQYLNRLRDSAAAIIPRILNVTIVFEEEIEFLLNLLIMHFNPNANDNSVIVTCGDSLRKMLLSIANNKSIHRVIATLKEALSQCTTAIEMDEVFKTLAIVFNNSNYPAVLLNADPPVCSDICETAALKKDINSTLFTDDELYGRQITPKISDEYYPNGENHGSGWFLYPYYPTMKNNSETTRVPMPFSITTMTWQEIQGALPMDQLLELMLDQGIEKPKYNTEVIVPLYMRYISEEDTETIITTNYRTAHDTIVGVLETKDAYRRKKRKR